MAVRPVMRLKLSVRCAVDCLGNALAVGVVAVGDAAPGLAHGRQLAAMLPAGVHVPSFRGLPMAS